jgi:hypothetical protein
MLPSLVNHESEKKGQPQQSGCPFLVSWRAVWGMAESLLAGNDEIQDLTLTQLELPIHLNPRFQVIR